MKKISNTFARFLFFVAMFVIVVAVSIGALALIRFCTGKLPSELASSPLCILIITVIVYALTATVYVLLFSVISHAFNRCLRRNVIAMAETKARYYPIGYFIAREGNIESNAPSFKKAYTVCVPISYEGIEMVIHQMDNVYRSVYYEFPVSYRLPDGISYLQPLICLNTALKLRLELCAGEVAYLIYKYTFPSESQIERKSETMVLDVPPCK